MSPERTLKELAPRAGLEPATLRLRAASCARNSASFQGFWMGTVHNMANRSRSTQPRRNRNRPSSAAAEAPIRRIIGRPVSTPSQNSCKRGASLTVRPAVRSPQDHARFAVRRATESPLVSASSSGPRAPRAPESLSPCASHRQVRAGRVAKDVHGLFTFARFAARFIGSARSAV